MRDPVLRGGPHDGKRLSELEGVTFAGTADGRLYADVGTPGELYDVGEAARLDLDCWPAAPHFDAVITSLRSDGLPVPEVGVSNGG